MNLKRNAIFNAIAILAIVALFAGTPVIADHQSFAMHFPHGYTEILHFTYFGPCVNWGKFMYLICYKSLPSEAAQAASANMTNATAASANMTQPLVLAKGPK